MVGADHPQRILTLQPGMADQYVLQRIVERMADVQAAGDIGRRVDNRIRFRLGPMRAIGAAFFPMLGPFSLDTREVECLVDSHGLRPCQPMPDSARL